MINLNDCAELGYLTRTHGIKGQITLKLTSFSFEEIEKMEWVYVIIDGLPVPFFIEEFSEKNSNTLVVKLEDVDSEPEARKYANSKVFVDNSVIEIQDDNTFNINSLKGYTVIDKHQGFIGKMDMLVDYGKNQVIRILNEKIEVLIPFQEEFFETIDDEKKEIHVNCPEGLLDLYLKNDDLIF